MTPRRLPVGRFERRILAALAAVALAPLLGALVFGWTAMREAYQVGVNQRVRAQLESSLELYRGYFRALRADADRTADAVAYDYRLVELADARDEHALRDHLEERLSDYPTVTSIRVSSEGRELAHVTREAGDEMRPLALTRTLPHGDLEVELVVVTPAEPFQAYNRAGELVEVFNTLEASTSYVSSFYVFVYVAFLLGVIAVVLAVGLVVSRRVTRRVVLLAEAAQRVGAGDLSVAIPTDERDEVGELVGAFNAMVKDIERSRDRIEYLSRMAAWQEMARRLAHEIKNPLTPIQLAVQEVHRKYQGDDARFRRTLDDARDIVEEEVTTLRRLVSDFSDFARMPAPELEPADLRAFVRDATRTMDPLAMLPEASRGAVVPELIVEADGAPISVRLDAQLLRKCLDNLVRNAVHALAPDPDAHGGRVTVSARVEGGHALLEVRDDGPGVAEDARDRVFDPYFTTKTEGTGLGLAIVKKIVVEHGGTIVCEASPDGGASFVVRLPLVGDAPHKDAPS